MPRPDGIMFVMIIAIMIILMTAMVMTMMIITIVTDGSGSEASYRAECASTLTYTGSAQQESTSQDFRQGLGCPDKYI